MDHISSSNPLDAEQQSKTGLTTMTALPARRRSKMACDTCHYRKIKCNVEKCYPCKNCEKNSVQCTMVGPSMRPPRSISGSSSAAAAAAVAMAMATVANARFSSTGLGHGLEGSLGNSRPSSPRLLQGAEDQRVRMSSRMEENQHSGVLNPLTRRSSASAQVMDDGSGSSDFPRHRRKLQSYSSSPSSLRNLFLSGGSSLRLQVSSMSSPYRHSDSSLGPHRYSPLNNPDPRGCQSAEAKGLGSRDYFNVPFSQPAGSLPSVSSPMPRGMIQFGTFDDSSLSSSTQSLSSSLPPTPTHSVFERSFGSETSVSPITPHDASAASFRPWLTQSSHRTGMLPLQPMPRRIGSAPYLVTQQAGGTAFDSQPFYHLPDRRSSLPWDAQISSSSSTPSHVQDPRGTATPYKSGSDAMLSMASIHHLKNQQAIKNQGSKNDPQAPSSHTFLMRSNSTPAIFSTPPRAFGQAIEDKLDGIHGGLRSTLMESAVGDSPLSDNFRQHEVPPFQQFAPRSERHGHPLEVIRSNQTHSPELHLQQPYSQQPLETGWLSQVVSQNDDLRRPTVMRNDIQEQTHPSGSVTTPAVSSPLAGEIQRPWSSLDYRSTADARPCTPQPPQVPTQLPVSQAHGEHRQQYQHLQSQQQPGRTCSHTSSLENTQSKSEMQFRAMKAEPMDDETFDSSLAMVLDDHLNLMDHLNMIPDGEVYHSTILLPPPIPAFKQEQPETAPQNNYQTHKATVMLPDANTTTTSTFQGVKQATKQNNISSGTGNGGGNNSESMFYYGAPEPMLRPMSATCQDVSFNYTGDNFMQVKVEPGLEQQQQHLQLCQKHTLQISTNSNGGIGSNGPANTRSYSRNDVAYYLTERLHPLDSTSMLQQQNQYEQQQQQYQYQQQFSRNQFEHPVSMLAAEHPFRSQ